MNLPVKISIARSTGGGTPDRIVIEITDPKSGIRFFTGQMTLEDFASALTGHGYCDVDGDLRGLEYVGKKFVREKRRAVYPYKNDYFQRNCRKIIEGWLFATKQEPGWFIDTSINSQDSVKFIGGEVIVNYSVYKYTEDADASTK